MAKYIYKARDSQGKLVRGSFEGDSRDAALSQQQSLVGILQSLSFSVILEINFC